MKKFKIVYLGKQNYKIYQQYSMLFGLIKWWSETTLFCPYIISNSYRSVIQYIENKIPNAIIEI